MRKLLLLLTALSLVACAQKQAAAIRPVGTITLSERSQRPSSYLITYEIMCKRKVTVELSQRFGDDPDLRLSDINLARKHVSQSDLAKINGQLRSLGSVGSVVVPNCGWINSSGTAKIAVTLRPDKADPSDASIRILELEFDENAVLASMRH